MSKHNCYEKAGAADCAYPGCFMRLCEWCMPAHIRDYHADEPAPGAPDPEKKPTPIRRKEPTRGSH